MQSKYKISFIILEHISIVNLMTLHEMGSTEKQIVESLFCEGFHFIKYCPLGEEGTHTRRVRVCVLFQRVKFLRKNSKMGISISQEHSTMGYEFSNELQRSSIGWPHF